MADPEGEETTECTVGLLVVIFWRGKRGREIIPCDGSWTKKPEDSDAHLITMVPEREIVNNASTKQTLKGPKEDSTDE